MVTIRLPEDLKERIDVARGDVPRERWVRRELEHALRIVERERQATKNIADETLAEVERQHVRRAAAKGLEKQLVEGTPLPKIAPRRNLTK